LSRNIGLIFSLQNRIDHFSLQNHIDEEKTHEEVDEMRKNNRKVSCDRVSWKEFLNFMKINGESGDFRFVSFFNLHVESELKAYCERELKRKNMKT
jgi:hypothetical protein